MNTECTMEGEPGHCWCGMLTMGAKGQFRLHSLNWPELPRDGNQPGILLP
jgi:hypothetical protein